ncbi:Elongation of very long chain fatty acids protein 4 [Clonorchis sinensis]|uniref:Elongation of very long chain fatty acids protein n=1 Tax=Clonorchis sinensis TaxID=79923 RepID=A0A8T1MN05_CLOSI|nr:Elongation of very long chain fatty acids protein 4 [Clonorchis sinensis]
MKMIGTFATAWAHSFLTGVDGQMPVYDNSKDYGDTSVANWLLNESFKLSWIYSALYLLVICYGLRRTKARQPMNLKWVIFTHDIAMVVFNGYIAYNVFDVAMKESNFFECETENYTEHPDSKNLIRNLWLFHVSKLIECLDTVFFLLSGKTHLVTWLHVYHHCTMIPYTCMMAKWIPDGQVFTLVWANGSVHVIMYTYYALAALGPAWRRFLWWKRYLTILQMIQFVYGISVAVGALYMGCSSRPVIHCWSIAYIFSILVCFYNHYHQTYRAQRVKSNQMVPKSPGQQQIKAD